jgi:hypothetical protein
MTGPGRYLLRMALFIAAVAAAASVVLPSLTRAFLTSPALNGLILGVLVLGIAHNFRQVLRLGREVRWLLHFRGDELLDEPPEPRLLAAMATMLAPRRGRLSLSAPAMRSLLDGIAARLDESRDLSRYTIGLLVFLGLLGTFWGLLQTVSAIGSVISGLSVEGGDLGAVFNNLKAGLEAPMAGMGTAFSSSLFGLAGSLILGFLDLQAGQAQNRFFNEVEDWLSTATRLPTGALLGGDGEQAVPAYVQALLERTADSLDALQRTLTRAEEGRTAAQVPLRALTDQLARLTEQIERDHATLARFAEGQGQLIPVLARLGETVAAPGRGGIDEPTRAHIRNIEIELGRVIDELTSGREQLIREVRSDIKLLARTIAAAAEGGTRPPSG